MVRLLNDRSEELDQKVEEVYGSEDRAEEQKDIRAAFQADIAANRKLCAHAMKQHQVVKCLIDKKKEKISGTS